MSFRLKTILGIAIIEAALLILLVSSSLRILHASNTQQLELQADLSISLLVSATRDALISQDLLTLTKIGTELVGDPTVVHIRIQNAQGIDIFNRRNSKVESAAANINTTTRFQTIEVSGQNFGTVYISLSRSLIEKVAEDARNQLVLIALLEVIMVGLFSILLGGYLTKHLSAMRYAARQIGAGQLGIQINTSSGDELAETSRVFNEMSLRVKDLYDEVKNSEHRMITVLGTVNEGILTTSSDGEILSLNRAIIDIFGYQENELIGLDVLALLAEPGRTVDGEFLKRRFSASRNETTGKRRKVVGLKKDGDTFPLEMSVNPMDINDERMWVVVVRNITEQELAHAIASEAQQLLAESIESSLDGFVVYDNEDRLVICNEKYKEVYALSRDLFNPGVSFEEIIRHGVSRGQYADAIGREEDWIRKRLEQHNNPRDPIEQKLENGQWVRIWENKTASGNTVGFRSDITELKNREEALRQSQMRLRATIESALDCIICVDKKGLVVEFNPAAEKCFGYSREHVLGRDLAPLIIPPRLRDHYKAEMSRYSKTNTSPLLGQRIEGPAIRKSGEEFQVEVAIEVAKDISEEDIFVAYLRDITDQKQYENTLKEASKRAEVANEAKASFVAMMSHEIRTPLNGVLGIMDLLSETQINDEQKKYIQIAKDSGNALLMIINDVLDFSKIEAGKLQLEETDTEILQLVESILEVLSSRAESKGILLKREIDEKVPWSVITDPSRVRQILLNLVDNAIKFTQAGSVTTKVSLIQKVDDIYRIRFEVIDTGIGIPEKLQNDVFGDFTTIDTSYARKYGGTGLGLAISKKLIELLGGHIGFESTEGVGTSFWFEVDAREGNISARDASLEERSIILSRSLRILVADDQVVNQMITRKVLENAGQKVFCVSNGIEAVQAVKDFSFDLILMDGSMPEMDGMEATRHIRKLEGPVKDIPIIALTAHAMKDDRKKFLDSGMNDYLPKPVQKEAILRAVIKWGVGDSVDPLNVVPDKKIPHSQGGFLEEHYLVKLAQDTSSEMLPDLIEIFLKDAKPRIERIKNAVLSADIAVLQLESHTLTSSTASYGLMPMHRAACAIELACVEGREEDAFNFSRELVEISSESLGLLRHYKLS